MIFDLFSFISGINRTSRCDGTYDCDDQSDERDCHLFNRNATCLENQFICSDGLCIGKFSFNIPNFKEIS